MIPQRAFPGLLTLGLLCLAGCGPKLGQVNGKVTFEGKPVTGGSISFLPKVSETQFKAGKSASGTPDENGEFKLSTFAKDDGALIGPHTVIFVAPAPPRVVDPAGLDRFKKFGNLRLPPGHVVEVKPGRNDVALELQQAP